jgi:hypothetical protein
MSIGFTPFSLSADAAPSYAVNPEEKKQFETTTLSATPAHKLDSRDLNRFNLPDMRPTRCKTLIAFPFNWSSETSLALKSNHPLIETSLGHQYPPPCSLTSFPFPITPTLILAGPAPGSLPPSHSPIQPHLLCPRLHSPFPTAKTFLHTAPFDHYPPRANIPLERSRQVFTHMTDHRKRI